MTIKSSSSSRASAALPVRPSAFPSACLDPTAALIFADGKVLWGHGIGAETRNIGEVCFNTAMTGYQEILTDLSYAGQIICFTSAQIGNVGTNPEDLESAAPAALGCILRNPPTKPSNYRATMSLHQWLVSQGIPGICNVDTRSLTHHLRTHGALPAMLIHDPERNWDITAAAAEVAHWHGLEGQDLAIDVTTPQPYQWLEGTWSATSVTKPSGYHRHADGKYRVTVIDYGVKHNILRLLVDRGCTVTVLPASSSIEQVMASQPQGVLLSNGPGDPAATGTYAVPMIQALLNKKIPLFGICLGHQMLALAVGGCTEKMTTGHHGANHPIHDHATGKAEITSQNHGFGVAAGSVSQETVSHTSLFDGTIAGLNDPEGAFFSVQYHPEASPGPMDSGYLFDRFIAMLK